MKRNGNRILSLVMALLMVLSLLPVSAFAETTTTWVKTELSAIKPTDTVAITMTKGSDTYILPSAKTTSTPKATIVPVENNILTTEGSEKYSWNIIPVDGGGYYIKNGEFYLYTGAANDGTRVNTTQAVWNVADSGYLCTVDSKGATRHLGVYTTKPDWRCYERTDTNIKNQTLSFWVLSGTVEPPAPESGFVSSLEVGDYVLLYNEQSSKAVSAKYVDTENLEGTTLTLEEAQLSGYGNNEIWLVGEGTTSGSYTFTSRSGLTLSASSTALTLAGSENTDWYINQVDGSDDSFLVKNSLNAMIYWDNTGFFGVALEQTAANTGIRFYKIDADALPSNKVSVPKANVNPGIVNSGTEVSFTCETDGAVISYHTGDSQWLNYTTPIAITQDTTFTVKAAKVGMEDSNEVTFSYTVYIPPQPGNNQAVLVTDVSTLSSGDRILIVARDSNATIGVFQKSNNRDQASVTKSADKLSLEYGDDAQIITLESGIVADTFALYATNGDYPGYLYASAAGNYLRTRSNKTANASFLITISGTDGTAKIVAQGSASANTIFYNKTSKLFSCYSTTTQKPVVIYRVLDGNEKPGMVADGSQVVMYNLAARGALAFMDGEYSDVNSCTIKAASAVIADSKAVCANGTVVFTAQKNGDFFRFYNEYFGYLSATGIGSNLFYSETASETSDWTVSEYNGGYKLVNRVAVNDGVAQYLKYASGSFTTGDMEAVTDRDFFTYHFYPCGNELLTQGIVNEPKAVYGTLSAAQAGKDYYISFTMDAVFGVKDLKAMLGDVELTFTETMGYYTAMIPAEYIKNGTLTVTVSGMDNKNVPFSTDAVIEVLDEPVLSNLSPMTNAQTKDNKRPEISADLTNAGENPTIEMLVNGEKVEYTYFDDKVSYTPAEDMADGSVTVAISVKRTDGKEAFKTWSFIVGETNYQLYFGQLHSHTAEYSDGSGTLADALEYTASLPESTNVDFLAFTDHSNYFDKSGAANPEDALYDLSQATAYSQERWTTYKDTIRSFNQTQTDFLAIPGFEMTWSGGPGHMNTFNTEGIVSRNNTTLNNKAADAGMQAYYALLSRDEGAQTISQFNHPGDAFGTFADFNYWDEVIDTRIQLLEVGNGEGAVHSSGYFPSYEYYTMALDKGWHVAPTNNQDNHKGKWGSANDARDVILAEALTEEALYDAIRARRVYATEDKNLEINYTINELPMGTIIESVSGKLNIAVSVMDPDSKDSISKVEVIVNSGKVAYTWSNAEELATGLLTAEMEPEYAYYYIAVTEADGDLAVTAPIWVGNALKLGVGSVESSTNEPITGEALTLNTLLYNQENFDALLKSLTYTLGDSQILSVDNTPRIISAGQTLNVKWNYTPTVAKITTITVTAVIEIAGKEYTFSSSIELDVMSVEGLTYIGIDAVHGNEYVSGHYKDYVGNFISMAEDASIHVEVLKTSEALIAACQDERFDAIVVNVPSRRSEVTPIDYTEDEIEAFADFYENGGALLISGSGDSNDKQSPHMATTQNRLLEALGSSLRLSDDGVYDGSAYSLTFNAYGDNALTKGLNGQDFAYYGGSSVYAVDAQGQPTATLPAGVSAVLFANAATVSKDVDSDGLGGNAPKYSYTQGDSRYMVIAMEKQDDTGLLVVAGMPFMNDYQLSLPAVNANNALCENWFKLINPATITEIARVREQTEKDYKYTIEGIVTSNASGYDRDTAFFDCIYVQDATGGICLFPVSGDFKQGDVVRVTATTDFYMDEAELQVMEIEKIGEAELVKPVEVTSEQINNRSVEGLLVTLNGTVTSIIEANGLVESIYVQDAAGDVARVFIDGYITAGKSIENLAVGSTISATGLGSYDSSYVIAHDSYARIRVRDRADIICTKATPNPDAYTITFDANGGTVSPATMVTGVDGKLGTLPVPQRTGYTFVGWFTSPNGGEAITAQTVFVENTSIYAHWDHTATDHMGGTATCTLQAVCEICNQPYGDKLPHTEEIIPEVAATCTATGLTEGCKCSVCDEVITAQQTIAALGHDYVAVVTAPTCTEKGYTTHTCSRCSDSYTDTEVGALGHDYVVTVTAPTCTEAGFTTHTCSRCSDSYTDTEVGALGHDYVVTVTAPTCTEAGFTTHTCSRCSESYTDTEVDALGHSWNEGKVTKEATVEEEGEMTFTCTRCGATTTESIPKVDKPVPVENPFSDVKEKDYFFQPVLWAVGKGVTNGTSPTTFSPDEPCTRAQAVTFLWRANGSPKPTKTDNPFKDVKAGQYYYDAVLWAVETGITNGTSPTTFEPDAKCTRGQIVTFQWRSAGQPKHTIYSYNYVIRIDRRILYIKVEKNNTYYSRRHCL